MMMNERKTARNDLWLPLLRLFEQSENNLADVLTLLGRVVDVNDIQPADAELLVSIKADIDERRAFLDRIMVTKA